MPNLLPLLPAPKDNVAMDPEMLKGKRRSYQFSLRTLLTAVALLAVPCGYFSWQAKIVAERRRLLHVVATSGGCYSVPTDETDCFYVGQFPTNDSFQLPIKSSLSKTERHRERPLKLRRWMGDLPVEQIWIPRRLSSPDAEYIATYFPEAGITLIPDAQ